MATKKVAAKKSAPKKAAKKAPAKKKVALKKSPLELLAAAGVIHPDHVAKHDPKKLKKLSPAEVATLIKIRKKLGPLTSSEEPLSPNFPV